MILNIQAVHHGNKRRKSILLGSDYINSPYDVGSVSGFRVAIMEDKFFTWVLVILSGLTGLLLGIALVFSLLA